MLLSGEQVRGQRACEGLERGGGSPGGGGDQPSSEAEPHARRGGGRPTLKRGGVPPEAGSHSRGRPAVERGGSRECDAVPLERSGVSLEDG
jgi:hypothetical protein